MSTRSNIIIYKDWNSVEDFNSDNVCQLYHHYDGYPEGVGADLNAYISDILKSSNADILNSPSELANYLCSIEDDTYENEGHEIFLHGDIEYLYVIDLSNKTLSCYAFHTWLFSLVQSLFGEDTKKMEESRNEWNYNITHGNFPKSEFYSKVFSVPLDCTWEDIKHNAKLNGVTLE